MKAYLKKMKFFIAALLTNTSILAQPLEFKKVDANTDASFRALSVVDEQIVWIGGSKGTVGISTDGGEKWNLLKVPGFEETDFRTVYGFNEQMAVIANVGSPAHILITTDGGNTWQSVYENQHKDAFIDGVDFWNEQEGIIYGDAIDGKMLLLKTDDGGQSWHQLQSAPSLTSGEASFAASGTGIRCLSAATLAISTGGSVSRLLLSKDKGLNWAVTSPPVLQGESSQGIFSVACYENQILIVGGDYKNGSLAKGHCYYSTDGGSTWKFPTTPTRGYRECVEFINNETAIAVGPTGMEFTKDIGVNWAPLNDESGFHVIRKARKGSLIVAAGAKGQIAIIKNYQ